MAIYLEFSKPHFEHVWFCDGTKTSPFVRIVGRGLDRCPSGGDGDAGWITVAGDEGTWEVSWREQDDDRLVVTDVVDHEPRRVPVQMIMTAKQAPGEVELSSSTR